MVHIFAAIALLALCIFDAMTRGIWVALADLAAAGLLFIAFFREESR
jgi:hypothetical protein